MIATRFGEFIASLPLRELPPAVVDAARLRVLDTLSAVLHGVRGGHHEELVAVFDTPGRAPVLGCNATRSLRDAIVVNAALAHATYFEDGSRHTGGHPASAVIPAALAVAHAQAASGRDLVNAVVAGYEVFLRLGRAIYPSTVKRGFQSTAILAGPASAEAAASVLGLDARAAAAAVAIGCSQGAGLKEALKASASQPLQIGRSSEGGVVAAQLAARGVAGPLEAIERGFLIGFADAADGAGVLAGLGDDWRIFETYLKTQGGCRGNHAPVDAVVELVGRERLAADRIARIDVAVDQVTLAASIETPADAGQAQFSIGFSIAVALVAGDVTPERFSETWLADPRIRALMARIDVVADAALDVGYPEQRGARVRITTVDGKVRQHAIDRARGEPEQPLSAEEVVAKFRAIAHPMLGRSAAQAVTEQVLRLETLDSVAPLMAALRRADSTRKVA
ncbi:MmgE/PrpD family protein [soil metagenome]